MSFELASGAEARWTGRPGGPAVVCVNGGAGAEVPGTWSASVEWLVRRLAPRLPLAFLEVRYRIKSWRRFHDCVADARDAIAAARAAGARELALLGFSMGGAVAAVAADDDAVTAVVGLAPWLHPDVPLEGLRGRRLAIVHGSLDRSFPGVPGVPPSLSLDGFRRALDAGAEASRVVIPGAVHAIALRAPWGAPVPLPRAGRWAELVRLELERFACA